MTKRTPNIEIGHYRRSRHWAVWIDSELLAVVCYRKGAEAIRETLLNYESPNARDDAVDLERSQFRAALHLRRKTST